MTSTPAGSAPPAYSPNDPYSLDERKTATFAQVWTRISESTGDSQVLNGALKAFRKLMASQEQAKISRNQLVLLRALSVVVLETSAKSIDEGGNISEILADIVHIFQSIPSEVQSNEAWKHALQDPTVTNTFDSKIRDAFVGLEEQLKKLLQGKNLEYTAYKDELIAAQMEDRKKIEELETIIRKDSQSGLNLKTIVERSIEENLKIIEDPTVQHKQIEARRALAILAELTGATLPPSTLLGKEFVTIGSHSIHSSSSFEIFRGEYFTSEAIAIKLLRQRVDEETAKRTHQRFVRQAMNWASLRHDAILPFYGIGVADSPVATGEVQLYLVSPYLQNQDVRRYLKKYPLAPLPARLMMALDVARGLYHMHETAELPQPGNGIVHSALNIFNILIKDSGRAVISGFGHSKVIREFEESFTGDNSEYRYMAPEMMHDEAKVTYGTDIWSWAMTSLEILTDVPPFGEKTKGPRVVTLLSTKQRPRRSDHPKIEEYHGADQLWDLFEKCWEEDPAARPSADDVVQCVRPILRELGKKTQTVEEAKDVPGPYGKSNEAGRAQPPVKSGIPPTAPTSGQPEDGKATQPVVPGGTPGRPEGAPGQD